MLRSSARVLCSACSMMLLTANAYAAHIADSWIQLCSEVVHMSGLMCSVAQIFHSPIASLPSGPLALVITATLGTASEQLIASWKCDQCFADRYTSTSTPFVVEASPCL